MTDQPTTTDEAGVQRTPTGEINNPTAVMPGEESKPTTTPTPTPSEPKTILNEDKPKEPEPPKAAEGAPKEYTDYKVPEGFTLDPEVKKQADALFKGMGLSQENAQKLVDFYAGKTIEAHDAPFKAYKEMTDKWRTDAEAHPDLRGKLGAGQEVNVRIGRFLDGLNDPKLVSDFKELMELTGTGNHQAFIRVIDSAARRLTEGSHVAGKGPAPQGQSQGNRPPPTAAEAMWPNLATTRPQ